MRLASRPMRALSRAVPLAAALLAMLALPAFAQGTPEQRVACAPDAVRLCPDTIPDVGRTKACMMAHEAELSPRCHSVFLAAIAPRRRVAVAPPPAAAPEADVPKMAPEMPAPEAMPAPMRHRRVARVAPAPAAPFDFGGFAVTLPDTDQPDAKTVRDARRARVVVGRLCRNAILDPGTCAFTNRMIDLAE